MSQCLYTCSLLAPPASAIACYCHHSVQVEHRALCMPESTLPPHPNHAQVSSLEPPASVANSVFLLVFICCVANSDWLLLAGWELLSTSGLTHPQNLARPESLAMHSLAHSPMGHSACGHITLWPPCFPSFGLSGLEDHVMVYCGQVSVTLPSSQWKSEMLC